MSVAGQLQKLGVVLKSLGHLAGYAGALLEISDRLTLYAYALDRLAEETDMAPVADVLRTAASEVRTAAEASRAAAQRAADAVASAIARLSDNESIPADVGAAILEDLNAAKAAAEEAVGASGGGEAAAGTIDPDAPGGVVADGSGGVTEPE